MAVEAGITRRKAAMALECFIEGVATALENGEKASFRGFGTFKVVTRAARKGRNPRTGAPMLIRLRRCTHFVPSKKLKGVLGR